MTKKEIIKFAYLRGYEPSYSGKDKRFYFRKIRDMDIHEVINSKS